MMRLLSRAAILSVGTVAFLALLVPRLYTGYDESAVRDELQAATPGDTLDIRTLAAIEEGDIDGALQYAALAIDLDKPISPSTAAELDEAQGTFATVLRGASDFAGAYITGHADNAAGLAGAVVSDLTVVGDVRDIISEGGKAAVGEDYSEFLLALAAIGLAAEGATIATGGTSLVFNVGVSILKVAKRAGTLTVDFSTRLVRLARAAARQGPEAAVIPAGMARTGRAARGAAVAPTTLTRQAARAELLQNLTNMNTVAANAGPANAVRLLRFVRTSPDASRLATFTSRFGRKSRAVAELTGKAALRSFRVAVRGFRLLVAFLWSMVAWVAGLVAIRLVRGLIRGTFVAVRGAVVAAAVP